MATKLDIISNARVMLGDTPAFDLNEIPEQERIFNSLYENMLQLKVWKFALKRVELSRDTDEPLFGYKYQYTLPYDFVRLTKFQNGVNVTKFELNGNKLLADVESLQIEYLGYDIPVESCPPTVVKYLEYQTAAELAYLISEDKQLPTSFIALADRQLRSAAAIDALNERNKTVWKSQFEYSRRAGGRTDFNDLTNTQY